MLQTTIHKLAIILLPLASGPSDTGAKTGEKVPDKLENLPLNQ